MSQPPPYSSYSSYSPYSLTKQRQEKQTMTATYKISHIGGSRGADELVVYRPGDCDGTT